MTSCYSLTYIIGDGAQTGELMMKKNYYLVNGLSPLKTSNPSNMAGDANNYEIKIKNTFVDVLLYLLTFGICTLTTTMVT